MSATDIQQSPPAAAPAATEEPARCDECAAAVDRDQRYCVNCGAHRRTANDPAARYFSQASSRSRAGVARAGGVRVAEPRRAPGVVLALALAVIPVAVGVGVAVGRSSNNDDGKLISALNHRAAQPTATVAATSSATQTSAASAGATSTHTGKHAAKKTKSTHKKAHPKHAAASSGGQTAAQKAGISSAPTKTKVGGSGSAAADQQGSKIVSKLSHTNGTGYLNQLPQQVVVP